MVFLPRYYIHKLVTLVGVSLVLALPLTGQAESLLPFIPKGKGEQCVEPTVNMRKHHMDYLLHHREDALRRGIRTSKFSLVKCIECHNPPGKDGKVVHITSKDHFCNSCHTYAAVTLDCFQCHADKPANTQYRHAAKGSH